MCHRRRRTTSCHFFASVSTRRSHGCEHAEVHPFVHGCMLGQAGACLQQPAHPSRAKRAALRAPRHVAVHMRGPWFLGCAEWLHSSSTVGAFCTGPSIRSGECPWPLPVDSPNSPPCDAEAALSASHALSSMFRKSFKGGADSTWRLFGHFLNMRFQTASLRP